MNFTSTKTISIDELTGKQYEYFVNDRCVSYYDFEEELIKACLYNKYLPHSLKDKEENDLISIRRSDIRYDVRNYIQYLKDGANLGSLVLNDSKFKVKTRQ